MSADTKIQWCDYSWSPWEGCTKVSPGCLNCYAEARDKRHQIEPVDHWGKGAPRRRMSESYWKQPLRWNKIKAICDHCGMTWPNVPFACCSTAEFHRPRVFPSLCDPFDDEVPIKWLADFLEVIHATPNLDWLLLTKRPENWFERLREAMIHNENTAGAGSLHEWVLDWVTGQRPPDNVWLGVSVEDQTRADERIPKLLEIPAKVRFLSAEPLLGPIDLTAINYHGDTDYFLNPLLGRYGITPPNDSSGNIFAHGMSNFGRINWLIIGGESGPNARPCNIEWIRALVRQGRAAGVPVFVKQLGSNVIAAEDDQFPDLSFTRIRGAHGYEGGPVRALLSHPKGGNPSEWPEDLRVREFPSLNPQPKTLNSP